MPKGADPDIADIGNYPTQGLVLYYGDVGYPINRISSAISRLGRVRCPTGRRGYAATRIGSSG